MSEDFKVKDISLADFGNKEIEIALPIKPSPPVTRYVFFTI